jgi:hypothetical protein
VRIRTYLLFLAVASLATIPALNAQDQAATPLQWGGFQVQGAASVGYRFTDVKGYAPMYQELLNLNQGPRLMDFNLFGHSDGTNPFADSFSLTTSGLGGDPYPSAQLTLSKTKLYDLRVNWRQSYFYWNQNDGVILPTRNQTGLTDNHDWANVRKVGSVDFALHATNNLRFNFQYYRTTFSGTTFTTFSPLFFGSESFGSFARANAYYMYAPIFDNTNRFTGGLDYTWRDWNFHYNVGYQTFTDNMTVNNVTSPQRAIDTTTSRTASELLSNGSWTAFRELKTPVNEFSYNGKPKPWLEMRGSYMFYRYRGPASFDQSYNGMLQTGSDPVTDEPIYGPYSVSQNARATVSEPNNIVEQGFTFKVKPWWDIDLDYRYLRFSTTTEGLFSSLLNEEDPDTGLIETESFSGEASNDWKYGMHQLDFNMMFTPKSNLVIRPGVTLFKTDVETLEDGEIDDAHTLRWKTVSPALSALYRPTSWLSLRGEVRTINKGASYTAITPHTDTKGRIVASLRLSKKFSLDNELYIVSQKLLATDFHGRMRSNSTILTYTLNDNYSVFGGFAYDSEFASGIIAWQRGVPEPGTADTLRDQAVNRVWQAGLEAQPVKYFGIRFTGNFVRTTGVGEESGINPVYGPLTYPYGTGTVYFNLPRAGRLSVDLQRTYYIQEIITGNNFAANMLTIRWTRSF